MRRKTVSANNVHAGAKLYALRDGFIYLGNRASSAPSKRAPVTLLVSLSGQPFDLRAGSIRVQAIVALVAPKVVRAFSLSGDGVASINIEPSHPAYLALVRSIHAPAVALENSAFAPLIGRLIDLGNTPPPLQIVPELFSEAICTSGTLLRWTGKRQEERVSDLIACLREMESANFDIHWCRRQLGLSPSRLSHLFTEQVGLSMRSFMGWRKTKEALFRLSYTPSITRVAHEAGFADSAHLSRSLKASIGILPSRIGCSRQIQFCDLRTC